MEYYCMQRHNEFTTALMAANKSCYIQEAIFNDCLYVFSDEGILINEYYRNGYKILYEISAEEYNVAKVHTHQMMRF